MNAKYLNDQWVVDDGLGIAGSGDQVARMSLEVETPFCIRVTGKWGSGKTSVLRRAFVTLNGQPVQQAVALSEDLKEPGSDDWGKWSYTKTNRRADLKWPKELDEMASRSLCVWYSPWQHQAVDNPLVPMLLEIQAQFSARMKLMEKAKNFNRRGGLGAMVLLEHLADAAASLAFQKNIKAARGATEAVRKAWREAEPRLTELSDGQRFHLLFEDAIENALLSLPKVSKKTLEQSRLIVFIDDLDRCEESVIVDLLECIKLYLGSRRCVFILGVDDAAVLGAMKRCWPDRAEDDNREYLEKMFQATVAVPLPRPASIRQTIRGQLEEHKFPDPDQCAETIEKLLEPNPRKIKNFCNSLCAAWNQFRGYLRKEKNHAMRFILFHYLRQHHPPVWRILEREPEALRLLYLVLINPRGTLPEITGFKEKDQRVLREMFTKAFLHVLKDDGLGREDDSLIHLKRPLSEAVALFEERLDRKRSDTRFIQLLKDFVDSDEPLSEHFLCLPSSSDGSNEKASSGKESE
ncbi:MAG: hypothetical protein GY859_40470 [Desulfobacterales bacterium]|nr:hypothetical protein [Desulfobacterales bacterium]